MNKRLNGLRKTLAKIIAPVSNAMSLPTQFLKYGNKGMKADWTEVIMSDKDLYTGYGYGAIRNRANLTARIALANVKTKSSKDDFIHPHLEMITKSTSFPDYKFWSDISTYLDLEGVYYLMAVRAIGEDRIGAVKEFKMLSPYNVRRIMDTANPTVVKGYVETRKGMVREIPTDMIIEIRELNPFDEDNPFAMTDAAKDSQFTLKTAGDFTRHALRNNINAPGILSTDVTLEEEEFKNFMSRVKNHTKGEPIFGNGQGAITWDNMQVELSKAALKDVNEMNRESLFAVSGVSKTIMGIEQSGVTRETSKVQKELIIENHILPRIQLIIDALNQDYELHYTEEFKKNKAIIIVDNPLGSDHEAEKLDIEVKDKQLSTFSKLINRGVDNDKAAQYIRGEIALEDLDLEPMEFPDIQPDNTQAEQILDDIKKKYLNQLSADRKGLIKQQEGALKNNVQNIEAELVANMLQRLRKKNKSINAPEEVTIDSESDLITKTERKRSVKELAFILGAFYGIVTTLRGEEVARKRSDEYNLPVTFTLDKRIKQRIKELSDKVGKSHVDIVVKDVYKTASEAALQGKSLTEIESLIKQKYASEISETRATAVARTETNRAFTIAQYEADIQFVDQNDLDGRVFKVWHTRSDNPCAFCRALEDEGPIPFKQNFRSLGDVVKSGDQILKIEFSHLEAGNAHPNCSCDYELIIE